MVYMISIKKEDKKTSCLQLVKLIVYYNDRLKPFFSFKKENHRTNNHKTDD